MGRLNYYFYEYTLESLIATLRNKSSWEISSFQKFELEMHKLLNGALDDFRQQALQKFTIEERNSFIKETIEEIQVNLKRLLSATDKFTIKLHHIGERFLAESTFFNDLIKETPVWGVPAAHFNSVEFTSNINNPVAFLEGLTNPEKIKSLKEDFYERYLNYGYSIDEKKELVTDTFHINEYVDKNTHLLPKFEKEKLIRLQKAPGNIFTETHYFSDHLTNIVKDEIQYSIELIKAYLNANPGDLDNYLKPIKARLISILNCTSLFTKYPNIKTLIKELQAHLRPANIKNIIATVNKVEVLPNLHFNLNISGNAAKNKILEIVFNTLCKYSDCTKPQVKQILGISPHLQKITWSEDLYELRYFINQLTEMFPAKNGRRDIKFKVAANCFLDKNSQEIDSTQIRQAKIPNGHTYDLIDNMKKQIQSILKKN